MAFGTPDLPRALADAGYRCHSIEQRFAVAGTKVVHPELVLCSDREEHTLIIEAKSGANLNLDQLKRYVLLGPDALVKRAFTTKLAAKHSNLLLIGQEQFTERLKLGSAAVPSDKRVLCVVTGLDLSISNDGSGPDSDDVQRTLSFSSGGPASSEQVGLKRVENEFSVKLLNDYFNPLLSVNWDLVPTNFMPIDHESPDWEFAQYMFPEIIAAILNGDESISVEEIARSFIRQWPLVSADYKKQLLDRMRTILKLASQRRFSAYLSFGGRGSSRSRVSLFTPAKLKSNPSRVRAQMKRSLRDLMADLNSPQLPMVFGD